MSRGALAAAAGADASAPSRALAAQRRASHRHPARRVASADQALCSTTRWPPASIQRRSAASRLGNMLQRREPMTSVARRAAALEVAHRRHRRAECGAASCLAA